MRAQILSDVMNLYFSHPAVEGVLLWGFWDGEIHKKDAALFTGQNVTVFIIILFLRNISRLLVTCERFVFFVSLLCMRFKLFKSIRAEKPFIRKKMNQTV